MQSPPNQEIQIYDTHSTKKTSSPCYQVHTRDKVLSLLQSYLQIHSTCLSELVTLAIHIHAFFFGYPYLCSLMIKIFQSYPLFYTLFMEIGLMTEYRKYNSISENY
jgi:hypothetical protein